MSVRAGLSEHVQSGKEGVIALKRATGILVLVTGVFVGIGFLLASISTTVLSADAISKLLEVKYSGRELVSNIVYLVAGVLEIVFSIFILINCIVSRRLVLNRMLFLIAGITWSIAALLIGIAMAIQYGVFNAGYALLIIGVALILSALMFSSKIEYLGYGIVSSVLSILGGVFILTFILVYWTPTEALMLLFFPISTPIAIGFILASIIAIVYTIYITSRIPLLKKILYIVASIIFLIISALIIVFIVDGIAILERTGAYEETVTCIAYYILGIGGILAGVGGVFGITTSVLGIILGVKIKPSPPSETPPKVEERGVSKTPPPPPIT